MSAACRGLTGSAGSRSGPVIVSPVFSTYSEDVSAGVPVTAFAIAVSTYAFDTVCIATLVGSTEF
ncbi:hypothetical protein [Granulicella paludicola]|uniref:hypothetical protein n=1 Tax=Granulicella paludicola TaxID=474951 RepID=UPI0021E0ABAF|nr:hypothetical protein [Granulicella paludicola]